MRKRKEDIGDKWLRENDPYYSSTDPHKSRKEDRPYETPDQELRRRRYEIPFSSLSSKQRREVPDLGLNYYNDDY